MTAPLRRRTTMPDTVRRIAHYTVTVPNRPGAAFSVLAALVSAGINLLACSGTPQGRRARIDVVPDDPRKFGRVAKKAGFAFDAKRAGFLIQGDDRPGALAEYLKRLAGADINVAGIDGVTAGAGRWGAILWVESADLARAARTLRTR
jgi:hypothetical protein